MSEDLQRYSSLWTVVSSYGKFLGGMYRTVVSAEEVSFGPLLEVETTIYLIYKSAGRIFKFESETTVLKFQELAFNTLANQNKGIIRGTENFEGIAKRISDYMNSDNEFELLFNILNSTKNQATFEVGYPQRIGDVMEMVSNKMAFYKYYTALLKDNFFPAFDNLYKDGISFMMQEPEQVERRLSASPKSGEAKQSARKIEPRTNYSGPQKKEGCFIATAVYGDYNHEKVLVLRKYRDENLSKSLLGRTIISFYYFTSPPLSKYFKQGLVRELTKLTLDKIIKQLNP